MTLEAKGEWDIKSRVGNETSFEEILKIILKNREVKNIEEFLNPELTNIPSINKLYDSLGAAKKIVDAVKAKKRIVIYGDYDVDGIVGTSILWSFLYFNLLEELKIEKNEIKIVPYIPDRVEEGYGLSVQSLDKLVSEGVDLIVTVDCGVRDKELIKKYEDIDFVITDHHLPPDDILDDLSYTLVHQLYPGKEYPFPAVCGAFISYLLVLAIKDFVGLESSIDSNKENLALVALATVTDIMPLKDVNRVLVKYGLEALKETENTGIKKLAEVSKLNIQDINTYHLGFVLGPRLNASGRMDLGMYALKLLCTKDESQATQLAKKLNALNLERQNLTQQMLEEAKENIKKDKLIIVMGDDWHEGIIGLVASKLQEEYYRPVMVFTRSGDEIKGSARSINGLNITELIERFSKYLEKFGGHAQAAGLSLKYENFSDFKKDILQYCDENLEDELFESKLEVDVALSTDFLNMDFAQELSKLEPFGYGNRKPLFMLEGVVVVSKKILGNEQNHMKIEIKGNSVGVDEAILFNCKDDVDRINEEDVLDLVGCIGVNSWNGLTKAQFEVKKWRYCKNGF
jgi:single-stranded-DNA-specific exonuclease